jgi:hypothetical protein
MGLQYETPSGHAVRTESPSSEGSVRDRTLLTNRIMFTAEVFVVMLVAGYIGWIAVAAVRSNRRRDIEAETHPAPLTEVTDAPGVKSARHASRRA